MPCSTWGASDHAVERELYRYYQPVEVPRDPSGKPVEPRPSHDISLTAFCQLGALRLGARRGIITLASRSTEYIIAESGRTLSLQDQNRHDPEDGLWHGVGDLKVERPIFPTLLRRMTEGKPTKAGAEEMYVGIKDISTDDDFSLLYTVSGGPIRKNARSLAAFPIRTPSDTIIGFYIVIDDKPRPNGLSPKEIQFMWDMSDSVMDHLESGRMKAKHARADGMVKALGLFVEGHSSLRNWWVNQELQRRRNINSRTKLSAFSSVDEQAENLFGAPDTMGDLDVLERGNRVRRNDDSLASSSVTHELETERNSCTTPQCYPKRQPASGSRVSAVNGFAGATSNDTTPAATPSDLERPDMFDRENTVSYDTSYTTPTPGTEEPSFEHVRRMSIHPPDELPLNSTSAKEIGRNLQEALLSTRMRDVFARAANLTREAIRLDGAIFYDASISSFGAAAKESGDEHAPGGFQTNPIADMTTSGSEDDLPKQTYEDPETGLASNLLLPESLPTEVESQEKGCNILGFSTRNRSSVLGHAPDPEHTSLPEAVLRTLLKKYPHGKVYNFHLDGTVSASDSENNTTNSSVESASEVVQTDKQKSRNRRRTMSKEAEAKAILKALPEARSVLFYPLWDPQRERWFAGGLIWSTSACRVLDPVEDLTYVASFGNSIMAEVARISAMLGSQMKTDFVSSISHELRSPLHGILASVELLQESTMSSMQQDMVSTIDSCGKTLLDTINHVLDFSKVNKKLKQKGPRRKIRRGVREKSRLAFETDESGPEEDMEDISVLTEEVIESVSAGSTLGKRLHASTDNSAPPTEAPLVSIIVDEDYRTAKKRFEVDAGAWRRILMNLFGNSMKYTKSGFVRVKLGIEHETPSRDGKFLQSTVSLTVNDSGKGISQEFLNTHLYRPFLQEDPLSPGTGLGLSIVRHIVHDLGGSIDFSSEQGSGTEARIVLPLKSCKRSLGGGKNKKRTMLSELRQRTKGKNVSLLGFDVLPDIAEAPTGILSAASQAKLHIKSAIGSLVRGWFGMQVSSSSKLDLMASDVHMILEGSIDVYASLAEDIKLYRNVRVQGTMKVIVILCKTHPSIPVFTDEEGLRFLHIQQPYGPHKVAKALHHALCQNPLQAEILGNIPAQLISPAASPVRPPLVHRVSFMSENHPPGMAEGPRDMEGERPLFSTGKEAQQVLLPEGPRVLLVEDNVINLKILITFMKRLSIPHVTAVNGLEALNHFVDANGKFDVIFMDISMPIMDGLTASRKIRQHQLENGIPPCAIIALTGAASMSARQEAFSAGIDLFLTKPVSLKRLKSIIEDLKAGGRDGIIEIQQ